MTSRIDAFLDEARRHLDRVLPEELVSLSSLGALIVDIRPEVNRELEGVMPGAIVIDRNVLEWRLDPTSPDRIAHAVEGRLVVLFCNDGYASSLAARTLQLLGLEQRHRPGRRLSGLAASSRDEARFGSAVLSTPPRWKSALRVVSPVPMPADRLAIHERSTRRSDRTAQGSRSCCPPAKCRSSKRRWPAEPRPPARRRSCWSGSFGFLAAGYLSAERLGREIASTRELSDGPFGVNLFVPSAPSDVAEVAR